VSGARPAPITFLPHYAGSARRSRRDHGSRSAAFQRGRPATRSGCHGSTECVGSRSCLAQAALQAARDANFHRTDRAPDAGPRHTAATAPQRRDADGCSRRDPQSKIFLRVVKYSVKTGSAPQRDVNSLPDRAHPFAGTGSCPRSRNAGLRSEFKDEVKARASADHVRKRRSVFGFSARRSTCMVPPASH
jgi:hypothetical protein